MIMKQMQQDLPCFKFIRKSSHKCQFLKTNSNTYDMTVNFKTTSQQKVEAKENFTVYSKHIYED